MSNLGFLPGDNSCNLQLLIYQDLIQKTVFFHTTGKYKPYLGVSNREFSRDYETLAYTRVMF